MKTILLVSIIAVTGISLTSLVFAYQHVQNCDSEGGTITGFLECNKSDYGLMRQLFQEKYGPAHTMVIDGVGASTDITSQDKDGNSITLTIKEGRNGPYHAEIACNHKTGGTTIIPLEDIIRYLQHEDCFSSSKKEQFAAISLDRFTLAQAVGHPLEDFTIKIEGYYSKPHAPDITLVNKTGHTIWTNYDHIGHVVLGRIGPVDFCKEYRFNDIGGPLTINKTGAYKLIFSFQEFSYEQNLSIVQSTSAVILEQPDFPCISDPSQHKISKGIIDWKE
jgi:hypothetical protein